MIVKGLDRKKKRCILIIESSDDLWRLRRFIRTGDIITTRTSRVIKERGEFSRPDKGERIRVTIKLYVEQVFLDNTLERLRVRGKVLEASDESVGKSGYHTFSITPGSTIYVEKEEWNDTDTKLIHVKEESKYLMIALDRREAGIGILRGGHLFLIATIDSGASGKAFGEVDISSYIAKVAEITIKHSENMRIVVAGPGNTKSILANIIRKSGKDVEVVEGFDLTGADGVRGLIKFQAFKRIASSSTAVKLQTLVEEAINRISNGDRRVAFSLENVREAAVLGAVDSCIVSDNVFRTASDEQLVVETLNIIEQKGATVYVADTSLEYGKQVSSFGGIIALLRYPFRAYGFNREMN